jgi:hypothetical protein
MVNDTNTVCCGKHRTTKFCPDCGKEIYPNSPLGELLAHIEHTISAKLTDLNRKEVLDWHCQERKAKKLKQIQDSVIKWTSWSIALREAIKSTEHAHAREGQ